MGLRVPVRGSRKLGTRSGLCEKLRPQQKQVLVQKAYPILGFPNCWELSNNPIPRPMAHLDII